jgi:hypothetical protein
MSFLNKSVNYSQTNFLKKNILSPLLKSYNEFLLNTKQTDVFDKDVNTGNSYDYLIPNNNKKYYLFIMKKNTLESQKTNYEILYFFPDQYNFEYKNDVNIQMNISDFCLEIDSVFDDELLLEGYLYKNDDKYEYLLTDILMKSKQIINVSFNLRYIMLNEIIKKIGRERLHYLNNHMTINIHPIFDIENEKLIKLFKNNFIYKNQIDCIEKISQFSKRRFICTKNDNIELKNIKIGKYTDVYNVYNINSNNLEGILYIKGIQESRTIKELFKNVSIITLKCKWNQNFCKWQPVFD